MLRMPGGDPARDAFAPPVMSIGPRAVRLIRTDAEEVEERVLDAVHEGLFYADGETGLRTWLGDDRHLEIEVRRAGAIERRRLLWIPLGERGAEGRRRYFGRWEHGADRAVLAPSGAGVILDGAEAITVGGEPRLVDVVRGPDLCLALESVPNGARVVVAEGLEGLAAGDVVSDIRVPELERGPAIEVHPVEAALAGFPPLGFRADFAGLPFGGFARALGAGSYDLARLVKRSGRGAYGALRPHRPAPAERDAHLEAALLREMKPRSALGRTAIGRAGTIALSDGRAYRVRAAAIERLPRGHAELLVAALLAVDDDAIELRVGLPTGAFEEPTPDRALALVGPLLIALGPWRA